MTLARVERRLAALEMELRSLRETLDYQQAVEGIRRGLESADRGEGSPVRAVFARLRRKQAAKARR